MPGIVYDTLDMEVYTHPSQDYEVDGNGQDTRYVSFTDSTSTKRTFAFGDPAKTSQSYLYFFVYRDSTRITDFTIDHQDKTVSIKELTNSMGIGYLPPELAPADTGFAKHAVIIALYVSSAKSCPSFS